MKRRLRACLVTLKMNKHDTVASIYQQIGKKAASVYKKYEDKKLTLCCLHTADLTLKATHSIAPIVVI